MRIRPTIKKHHIEGFTIVELLLATAVFSLVLLGALSGFLQTGRLFYKGVSITATQAIARQIIDDVSTNLQNSTSSAFVGNSSGGYSWFCVGNVRYTFNSAPKMVDFSNAQTLTPGGNFGLIRQSIGSCTDPCQPGGGCALPLNVNSTEMLGNRMRVSNFQIAQSTSRNLFNITITVAYGDDSSLVIPTPQTPNCTGSSQNQQFCAVSTLSTSVFTEF